jgi:hypothetical protein
MSVASQSNLDSTMLQNNHNITDLNHNLVNNGFEDQTKENHVKCKSTFGFFIFIRVQLNEIIYCVVSCDFEDELNDTVSDEKREFHSTSNNSNDESTNNLSGHTLKPTLSEAMMNSNLLQSLPKYIFQSDHEPLKSVKSILRKAKEDQAKDETPDIVNNGYELPEYPIEIYEHQQHALQRHMSIK